MIYLAAGQVACSEDAPCQGFLSLANVNEFVYVPILMSLTITTGLVLALGGEGPTQHQLTGLTVFTTEGDAKREGQPSLERVFDDERLLGSTDEGRFKRLDQAAPGTPGSVL